MNILMCYSNLYLYIVRITYSVNNFKGYLNKYRWINNSIVIINNTYAVEVRIKSDHIL